VGEAIEMPGLSKEACDAQVGDLLAVFR